MPSPTTSGIPPLAHFVWFGSQFPWVYHLAIRSAIQRGGFQQVVLHHADDLRRSAQWDELQAVPRFEARRLRPEELLEQVRGGQLVDVYRDLQEPAARANLVRVALLYLEGGTFLDVDTVTLRSFAPLLERGGAFCGQEHITRPYAVLADPSLALRLSTLLRRAVRSALRETPGGWRAFRRIEALYPAAVNNAVMGSEAQHPFLEMVVQNMLRLSPERRRTRYALGTHLLQQTVDRFVGTGLWILPPQVFYPLGPEISLHWFRLGRSAPIAEVVQAETILVHWYASVRTRAIVPAIDAGYVRAHARVQLFSALALPFVEAWTGPAADAGEVG
jgi:hypothetical protein